MIYPADDLSEGKQYYEAVMSQNAENIDGDHIIYYNDAYLLAQTSDYTGFSTAVSYTHLRGFAGAAVGQGINHIEYLQAIDHVHNGSGR